MHSPEHTISKGRLKNSPHQDSPHQENPEHGVRKDERSQEFDRYPGLIVELAQQEHQDYEAGQHREDFTDKGDKGYVVIETDCPKDGKNMPAMKPSTELQISCPSLITSFILASFLSLLPAISSTPIIAK